ncbi:SDR family oxidoreductase [Erythrobacter rubeus]|uniref:SDR family oxidoreductase n=1 Tax=Erythrobacter rubeus TaxID=2760803 RepID=A0ABR8KTP2_9SPHN|nr:SDR family oxidoreductase [Erythrobacter rubeus]MBD2841501.1 SDR family oxidoreductase [Erythrobacter rubeus]
MTKKILLFGATGDTGRHVLDQALERGHSVRGAEREWPTNFCDHKRFEQREGDLIEGRLASLMDGIDCVISAVGLGRDPQTLINPPALYTEGAVQMVKAMRAAGVTRLVTISAAFADPDATVPLWFKAATAPLDRIFRQMGEMERVLRVCDDIEWTAVRPGWLLNRVQTGDFEVSLEDLPAGKLRTRRADLAQFMLDCALDGLHVHETPFIARKESIALETPPALIEELLPF